LINLTVVESFTVNGRSIHGTAVQQNFQVTGIRASYEGEEKGGRKGRSLSEVERVERQEATESRRRSQESHNDKGSDLMKKFNSAHIDGTMMTVKYSGRRDSG
jgi:hypothetical protein